jgi:hypothetical protein
MALPTPLPATARQIPDHAILDYYNKPLYLGNSYTVTRSFTVGTSEVPLILMQNVQTGAPSNMVAMVQTLLKVVENTAAQSIILNVYMNPTFSAAGTALTPQNQRGAYGNNAAAKLTYTPTVSMNGTLVDSISAAALTVGSSQISRMLDNGQNLLVTGIASTASTAINTILGWYEI